MKKILAIMLVIALLSIMAIGTTLSYFKDSAFDQNTMTVGTVTIKQNEVFDKESAALRPYIGTPVADTNGLWAADKNAVTKTVTVTNTGSEAAYIRTLFAFEAVGGNNPVGSKIHVNYNTDTTVGTWAPMGSVVVKGVTYYVYSFTYTAAVAGNNEKTAPSLKQIALDCDEGNDFSTQVGGEYDILVVSQAVQSTGFGTADAAFTAAFGALNASWFTAPTTP